jgi:23S rRNA (cytosine1962-C5)-methyltransferase
MLANRVGKTFKKLAPGFAKEEIEVFRLYDWDIPEVRMVVDWYNGHLVCSEYTRQQTENLPEYALELSLAAARALNVPEENVHVKGRRTRPRTGDRYEKRERTGHRMPVKERGLSFWVNLDDFLDTGLFADHRETRQRVREEARGKRVLNLFCYTGAFSVYAAAGGARQVTSVDASRTYLDWAEDNFALNGLRADAHRFMKDDAREHLFYNKQRGDRYDLIVCDPPSFSVGREREDFDVQRDHPELVRACLDMLLPGGVLYFSTNHQRFESKLDTLGVPFEDITAKSVPKDYRNRTVHRCYRFAL